MKEQQEQKGSLYRVRPRSRRRWLEQTPTLFSTLLFLLFLLSSPSLAQDTSSVLVEYDCVYTNSTVPSCSSVCSQTCFYSLLPATCSPEGNDLVYESISRPDSTGPSVVFDDAYNVPQSVLERLSPSNLFLNPFTLSMWVYPMEEIADNSSVLIQIESMDVELTLYLDSRWLLITNSSSLLSTMNSYNTTYRLNLRQWTHLTVIASDQDELIVAVDNSLLNTSLTIDPISDEPISISLAGDVNGDYHFSGLMSDVGAFSNSLSSSQVSILAGGFTPPEFLPQCLCREGLESELCDGSLRYRINSHPVEFITDNDVSTYWESNNSSVSVSLGLATVTSLSKIFFDFRDFSPVALRLQYLREPTKVWSDIQFYARDCSTSFGQEETNSVNSISSVICQAISSNDTSLAFYVTANGRDKFSTESLSSTFNASQIRLVIQSNSMETIRLERVQVCSKFETNLNTLSSCMAPISSSSSYSFDATRSSSDVLFTMESVDSPTETFALDSSMIISSARSSSFFNLVSSSESVAITTFGVESIFPSSTQSVMNIEDTSSSPFALTSSSVVLTQSSSLEQATVSSSDFLMSESNVMITSSETFVFLSSSDVASSGQLSTSSLILESSQELVSQSLSVEVASTPFLFSSTELMSLSESLMIPSPSPSEDVAIESSPSLVSSIVLMTSSTETGVTSDILSVSDMLSFNSTSAIVSSEVLLSSSDDLMASPSPSRVITTSEGVLTSSDISLSSSDNDMNFVSDFSSFLASFTEVSSSAFDVTSSIVPSSFVTLTQFTSSSSTLEMTSFLDTEGFSMATISEQTSTLQLPTIEATSTGEMPSPTIEVSSTEDIELSPSLSIEATSSSNEGIELTPSLTIEIISSSSIEATSSEGIEETPSLSIEVSSTDEIEPTPSLSIEATSTEELTSSSIFEVSSSEEIEATLSFTIRVSSSPEIEPTSSLIIEVSSSPEIEPTSSLIIEVSSSPEIEPTSSLIIEVSSSPEIEPTSSLIIEVHVSSSPEIEPTSSLIIEVSSSPEIESTSLIIEVSSSPEIEPTSSLIIEVSSSPEIEPTSSLIIEVSSSPEIESTSSLLIEVSSSPEIEPTSSLIIEVSSSPEIEPTSSLIIEVSSSPEIEPTSSLLIEVSSSPEIEPTSSLIIEVSSSPEIEPTSSLLIEVSSSPEIEPTLSLIIEVSSSPEIEPTSSLIIEVSSSPEIEPTSSLIIEVSSSPEIEPTSSLIIEVSSSPEIEPTSSLIIEVSSSPEIEPTSSLIIEVSSSPEIEPTSSLIIEVSSSPEIEPTSSLIIEVSSSPEIEPTSSLIIEVSSSPEIEPTSSLIIEVSSSPEIEPTSSLIIEVSSSPEIEPTSSLIIEVSSSSEIESTSSLIIEVSSTEVIQSSSIEVSSSEEIEPTPSPTIAISSSEEIEPTTSLVPSPSPSSTFSFISVSVTPTVTINEGFGVILEEPQKIESNDNLMYNFSFGLFGIKLAGEDASSIKAQIGNFSVQESFTQNLQTIKSITGALSTDSLWPDQPLLTILVQARDMFNNTVEAFSPLIITAEHTTLGLMEFYECASLPVVASGTCTAMISIDDDWFTSNEISSVTFTIEVNETVFTIGSVELHSPPSISLTNSLYIQLPQTPLMPGGAASLSIKSSYNYSIFGFNIDCRLEGGGENAAIISPHSPQEYSLLYEYYQDQRDRIALSGFRNRNQFSTAPVNRTLGDQTLVTFNLLNISENYDISCYSKGLSLTTRLVLVPVQASTTLPVLMISRDGNVSEVGEILHQEKRVAAILPFARHNTFLNIATVNRSRQDLGAIKAIALYNDGTFDEASSLTCTSLDKDAIQVESDCSNIYFNGSETDGIDANITVRHAALNDYSSLLVRVWILRQNLITISLKDSVLNATGTCNNSTFYQSSEVSLQGIIIHNEQMHTVIVTRVLKHLLTTNNTGIARVDGARVVGQSPGTTRLCLGSSCTNVTVSNDFASPLYLSLFPFSSLTINLDSLSIDPEQVQVGLISVGQEFHYRSQPVFVNTLLVYEDDSAIDIDTSSELYLSIGDNQIYNRLYLIQDGDDGALPVIGGTWSQCSETVSGSVAINISLYSPLSISIDATTLTIAPRNDPLVVLGYAQSDSVLTLIAEYEDPNYDGPITSNATYNVTANDTSVLIFSTDVNGSIALYPVQQGYANVQVYVFEYDLGSSINVTVLESEPQIRFLLNTDSSAIPVNTVQRIANTQYYQEVRAEAILYIFLTNTTRIVTNAVFTSGNTSILQLNGNTVSVSGVLNIDQNINITATLNGGESNITATASLGIGTDSCDVTGVQIDFPNEFIDFPGMERIANCRVTLCNGALIEKTFNSQTGAPLYGNEFVSISITDSIAAIVINNTSTIRLNGTAVEPVSVYCTSGIFNDMVPVIFNTLPDEGEVDLGTNDGLPFTSTDESDIMIPVTIGAGSYKIGAIEIDIQYDPKTTLFLTASQGMDWSNGSLSVAEVSTNSLRLGGVLNNGVQDSTLHLANVYFKTLEGVSNNVTILTATPVLLAVGNISLTDVTPGNPQPDTLSVALPNSRSRRDLRRTKRQASTSCPPYPVGDINADCCVDQRDVYYFQEYNLASIHNFTGSEEASLINQTIEDNGIVVDVDGDGFVTLDDIVTVEQVSSGLVYNMSASYDISCDCSFVINISMSTVNGLQVETESLHVFVHLAHNQSQFIEQVKDIQFSFGSLHQVFEDNNGLYTAVLRANLSTSGDTTALYQVRGTSNFSVPDVGLSFIQAVADNNGEISESRVSGLFGSTPLSRDEEGPFTININATGSQVISLTLDGLMPHIIINPTCINVPPTTLPSLPLLLQVNRDEYFVSDVTQLNQTYYEGRVLILSNNGLSIGGSVTASVESLHTSLSFSRSLSQVNSLRHPIALFDEYSKVLTTTVQAFNNIDYTFNAQSSTINISIVTQSNDAIANTVCIPNNESGICQSSFNLSSNDFSQLTVTFSLIGIESDVIESSMVTVDVSSKLSFQGDGVSILLPSYTLKPGSTFDIEVYSNTTYPLISFLFNFTLSPRIRITGTHSPDRLWGVYCTQNLSCVGYRTNFQSLSVSQLSSPEHLFTASLYIPEDYTESNIIVSASVREMHNLFYQLVPLTDIMIVNASGTGYLNEATVSVDPSNDLIALYAHAPQTELVNTAVLNEELVTIPISVSGLYENNTIASVSGYSCQLIDSTGETSLFIDNDNDCSAVFMNGSETKGADNVTLKITLESVATNISFKVWFPSSPVKLQLGSDVLKAIDGAIGPTSCGAQLYQSTTITVMSNLTTTTESLINVDLSQYILNRIRFIPDGSIELNETSRTIQGISSGIVTLYPSLYGLFDNVTLQVSEERISIHYLYTIILSSISLRASDDTSSSGEYNFSLSLSSSFQYVNDTGVSVTLAVFSDGSTMPVTDLVSVRSSKEDILYSTDNGLFTAVSNGSTTIRTEWYNPSTANCTPTVSCLRTSYDDVSLSLSLPTELIVIASSVQLAACETIAQLLPSIPLQVELYVLLVYPNGDRVNVTEYVSINDTVRGGDDTSVIVLNANTLNNQSTTLLFSYYVGSGVPLMKTISIEVVSIDTFASNLSLLSVPGNDPITTFNSIGGSIIYQQAQLVGSIAFSDGIVMPLSSLHSSMYNIGQSSDAISINDMLVIIPSPPNALTTVNISLMLTGCNEVVASIQPMINTRTDNVINVNSLSITTPLIGRVGEAVELDVSLKLNEGDIYSLRDFASNARANITDIVSFTTTDTEYIGITQSTATCILYRQSGCSNVTITITITGGTFSTDVSASVVILPGSLEIGLEGPVSTINTNRLISLPLSLNTHTYTISGIEGSLIYNSSLLQVVNLTVEGTQWPGGVIFHNTESISDRSVLIFSGLAFNGGVTGDNVHFATVNLMTKSEGSTEVYAYLTNLIQYKSNSISINESVSTSSRITLSISNNDVCNQPPYQSNPLTITSNCSSNTLSLASDESSITCPVSLNTTTETLYSLLQTTGDSSVDVNLNGVSDLLDPLYVTQVSSGLLYLLNTYPVLTNSTRDVNGNYCNVTISSKLIGRDGRPPNDLSLYYLLNIHSSYSFDQLFNASLISSNDSNVLLIPSTYNEETGEFTSSLSTMLTEIPGGTVSVSLIQSTQAPDNSEYSPAGVLLMNKRAGETMNQESLSINTADIIVRQDPPYAPLVTFTDDIICPTLLPTLFEVLDVEPSSRSFSFRIEAGSGFDSIMLYNCSLIENVTCLMGFMNHPDFTRSASFDIAETTFINVTVAGLNPYTNYTFQLLNTDGRPITLNETITTAEAQPEGFNSLTVQDRGPTNITIKWELPTEPNGILRRIEVFHSSMIGGARRKRELGDPVNVSVDNTQYTITDLSIATVYYITVTISNSVGSISQTISTNTTFPEANFSKSEVQQMNGCVNLTTEWIYDPVDYDISLHCTTNGMTSDTVNTTSLTNDVNDIVICYDGVNNGAGLNETFECDGTYTVTFTFMKNNFNASSETTVQDIPIIAPTVTSTVVPPVSSSIEVSSSMESVPSSSMFSFDTSLSVTSTMSVLSPSLSSSESSATSLSSSPSTSSSLFTSESSPVSSFSLISTSIMSSSSSSSTLITAMTYVSVSTFLTTPSKTVVSMTSTMEMTSEMTSTILSSISTAPTSTSTPTFGTTPSSSPAIVAVGVVLSIIILLVIVLIFVILLVMRRRTKKRGTMDFYRPGSRTSKDYWFEVEETVEMSPIDIVPVDHQPYDDHYLDETVMSSGIIENKGVYEDETISHETTLSSRALVNHIKPQPRQGRTVTFNSADPSSFTEPTRPSYDDVVEDNESLIDLNFSEDAISQPYLSLGLTPLSQLSPDPLTSSGNPDLGFFPSMLPPVSPMTSLKTGTGISVDSPDTSGLDNLVMPDAMLNYSVPLNDVRRRPRNRQDSKESLLNGNVPNSRTLEPLIERRSLEVDEFSSGASDIMLTKGLSSNDSLRAQQNMLNLMGNSITAPTGSSEESQEDDTCIFPSAHVEPSPPLKQKKPKAAAPKSGSDLFNEYFDCLELGGGSTELSNYRNTSASTKPQSSPYTSPVPQVTTSSFMDSFIDEPKQRRQLAREKAKAEQKAFLMKQREEEELQKQAKSRSIHDSIVKSYSTFSDSPAKQPSPSFGIVLQKAAHIEAAAELLEEESKKVKNSQQSQDSIGTGGDRPRYPSVVFSPQHRYSSRPRQASTDSVDMKVTDSQITAL